MIFTGNPRIALFGGSFDPVHLGHQAMIDYCLENFDFDRIDIIPAKLSPFKKEYVFSDEQRLKMLTSVFNHPRISINKFELEKKGASYTALTIKNYLEKEAKAKLYWIIGSDHIETLKTWNEFEFLKEHLTFIIFARSGYSLNSLGDIAINYELVEDFNYLVSSTQIKTTLLGEKFNESQANRLFDGLVSDPIEGLLLEWSKENSL